MHDANAVVEVFAELARNHQGRQIAVRRRNYADIHRDGFNTPQRFDDPFLQYPQKSHLHGGGDIANFVEEDRSTVGPGEPPWFVSLGVGERAGLVTEQFALQQRIR